MAPPASAAAVLTLPDGRLHVGTHLPLLAQRYKYLSTLGEGVSAQVRCAGTGGGHICAAEGRDTRPRPAALSSPPPAPLLLSALCPAPLFLPCPP